MASFLGASSLFRRSNGHTPDTMQRMQTAIVTLNMRSSDLDRHRSDLPGPNIIGRYDGKKTSARVAMCDQVFTIEDGSENGHTDVSTGASGFSNFAGLDTKGRTIDKMVKFVRWVGVAQTDSERDVEDGKTGNFACAGSGSLSFPNNGPDNMAIGTGIRYVIPPSDPQEKYKFDRMRTGPIVSGRDTAIVRAYDPTDLIFMWKECADILLENSHNISVPDMVSRQTGGVSYGRGDTSATYLASVLKEFVSACAFAGVVQACERGIVTPVTISPNNQNFGTLYRNSNARLNLLTASSSMTNRNTSNSRDVSRVSYDGTNFKAETVQASDRPKLKSAMTDFYRYLAASFNLISEEGAAPENLVLTNMVQRMVIGFGAKKLSTINVAHELFDTAFGSSAASQYATSFRPNNQLAFVSGVDTTDDHIRRTLQGSFARFMRAVGYTYNVEQAQIIGTSLSNTDAGGMLEAVIR